MGSWYWIGVAAGVGVSDGVFNSVLGPTGRRFAGLAATALIGGAVLGLLLSIWHPAFRWGEIPAGGLGGLLGFLGSAQIVSGALRRGGTRGGIAILVAGAAVVVAGIAFIPVAGYLEALSLPALAARLRRTQPERYAGLRTLARD